MLADWKVIGPGNKESDPNFEEKNAVGQQGVQKSSVLAWYGWVVAL